MEWSCGSGLFLWHQTLSCFSEFQSLRWARTVFMRRDQFLQGQHLLVQSVESEAEVLLRILLPTLKTQHRCPHQLNCVSSPRIATTALTQHTAWGTLARVNRGTCASVHGMGWTSKIRWNERNSCGIHQIVSIWIMNESLAIIKKTFCLLNAIYWVHRKESSLCFQSGYEGEAKILPSRRDLTWWVWVVYKCTLAQRVHLVECLSLAYHQQLRIERRRALITKWEKSKKTWGRQDAGRPTYLDVWVLMARACCWTHLQA